MTWLSTAHAHFWALIPESPELQAVLLATLFAVVGYFLQYIFAAKGKVWWSKVFDNVFIVPQNDGSSLSVNVVRHTIRNYGKLPVENLEISLNWPPQHTEIFPHIPWKSVQNPDQRTIITFESVNSGDLILLSLLSVNADCPAVTNVRFKGGTAGAIETVPQKVYKKWMYYAVALIMFVGAVTMLWIIARALIYLAGS